MARDFRREGRTVETLGLAGMTAADILRYVTEGDGGAPTSSATKP